ncbi:hypothetical protein CHM34_17310 [Paludifilum halophilum]|uniref:Uncharacterized protein n=1 Tax=Paludifilum halophilum TaxID=1642702 RepID=A0A235B1N5_9BACL|nr:hypothetical protein CHM34_17310 [Paludifilum halophilum]
MLEISSDLHYGIFKRTNDWGSYLMLRKIKDYYKTDLTLANSQIDKLRSELEQVSLFLDERDRTELFKLTTELVGNKVQKVRVTGD